LFSKRFCYSKNFGTWSIWKGEFSIKTRYLTSVCNEKNREKTIDERKENLLSLNRKRNFSKVKLPVCCKTSLLFLK
jgi:hypothetical protein